MKKIIIFIIIVYLFFYFDVFSTNSNKTNNLSQTERAVSLQILQKKLQSCMSISHCPEILLNFGGLTKIEGFILDEENDDIIVFGIVDSNAPPLRTEDFVVALRNAWHKYVANQGNIIYYSNPGCSIDPDPNVIKQLSELANKILSNRTFEGVEKDIKRWHRICRNPQYVQVLGIPFNTHFADVMIEADYYMKRLVDGSVQLNVNGFESLIDMTLARIKEDIINNRPISIRINPMNRFEFYPGENRYLEDEGIVIIEKCLVILITEVEYLTRSGRTQGAGQSDPLAKKFADSFSLHYNEIAIKKGIYYELEGLFRIVALAKILKHKNVKINLDYFLEDFPVSEFKIEKTKSGIPNVKEFKHQVDFSNGYQLIMMWLPSCGGVGIEIDPQSRNFKWCTTDELSQLKERILNSRPILDELLWDYYQETPSIDLVPFLIKKLFLKPISNYFRSVISI